MNTDRHLPDLAEEEKAKPYARFYYREPAPIPDDVQRDIDSGHIDPRNALAIADVNELLNPGYLARETGYCFLPDGSGYTAVLTRMPGVTAKMLEWWFCWHSLEDLRYKIWFPGAHTAISVRDRKRIADTTLSFSERCWNNPHYPVEDIGVGSDLLSITFMDPRDFGFDVSRFKEARVATVLCTRVGSVRKGVEHTRMCHFVRETDGGVEMRSRFWIGAMIRLKILPKDSPLNRPFNTRFIRKIAIPRDAPRQMARHCAQEYNNLARILPKLYKEYGTQ
jgi:phloretin hydrolase